MKKTILLTLLLACVIILPAQKKITIQNWLKTTPVITKLPVFSDEDDVDGNKYSNANLLEDLNINLEVTAEKGKDIRVLDQDNRWEEFRIPEDSILLESLEDKRLILLSNYLTTDQWAKIDFSVITNALFEVYMDGDKKHSKTSEGSSKESFTVNLHPGKHHMTVKLLSSEAPVKFSAQASYDNEKFDDLSITKSLSPEKHMNIHDVLDGESIRSAQLSHSGKYILTSYSDILKGTGSSVDYTILTNLEKDKDITVFRNKEMNQIQWLPKSEIISYTLQVDEKTNLYTFNFKTGQEKEIVTGIDNFSHYRWAPDESYILYSATKKADDPGELKRIYGNEDRIPGFRERS
ncbi:MAG: hypothetical protein R6U04_13005 [Bacteroidales bacterium]